MPPSWRRPGGTLMAPERLAEHVLRAESDDPRIVKEIHVTMYQVLWEPVHVFLVQPGVLRPGRAGERR